MGRQEVEVYLERPPGAIREERPRSPSLGAGNPSPTENERWGYTPWSREAISRTLNFAITQTIHTPNQTMKTPFKNSIHALRTLGLIVSLGSLPLVFSMTGCASSDHRSESSEHRGDWDVTHRVTEALENHSRHAQFTDVHVLTTDGVVTLTGYVNTDEQKVRAGEIARTTPGVVGVINHLVVRNGS